MEFIQRHLILVFGIVLISPILCYTQDDFCIPYVESINTVIDFSKSAVLIQTPLKEGTGIFINIPFNDIPEKGNVIVITAKHVLGSKFDTLDNPLEYFDTVVVSMKTQKGQIDARKYVLADLVQNYDLAFLAPIDKKRSYDEYETFTHNIDSGIAVLSEIKRAQTVFVAGYPFGVGSESITPVIQSGIISYIDTTNLFALIDIPINYGNSGGPAYVILNSGEKKLLGLILGFRKNSADKVLNIIGDRLKLKDANSSLGVVLLLKPFLDEFSSWFKKIRDTDRK
ncbi:MAG: serine protease [Bacteroidota bacterium]|nr:serine protease [Bacteroidota bacterium]